MAVSSPSSLLVFLMLALSLFRPAFSFHSSPLSSSSARALVSLSLAKGKGQDSHSTNHAKGFARHIFKEQRPLPSIDELAKQQQLRSLLQEYKSGEQKNRVFDDTIDFPTAFTLKVIGVNDASFVNDILSIVGQCIEQSPSSIQHSTRMTTQGNYLSITLSPVFQSANQIYAVYEAVGKDHRVKFVL